MTFDGAPADDPTAMAGASSPAGSAVAARPMLVIRGVTKTFPGVTAVDDASLDVRPGEIHALLGENGAGKSTLMHLVAGVYQPDRGDIELDGGRSWAH
jgi:ABC-type sugar transport system ATPase subunit